MCLIEVRLVTVAHDGDTASVTQYRMKSRILESGIFEFSAFGFMRSVGTVTFKNKLATDNLLAVQYYLDTIDDFLCKFALSLFLPNFPYFCLNFFLGELLHLFILAPLFRF